MSLLFQVAETISESEAGDLIRVIKRNTKVEMHSTADPNAIINLIKPVIL